MGIDILGHENTKDFKLEDAVNSSSNINADDITNNRFTAASINRLFEKAIMTIRSNFYSA